MDPGQDIFNIARYSKNVSSMHKKVTGNLATVQRRLDLAQLRKDWILEAILIGSASGSTIGLKDSLASTNSEKLRPSSN